MEYSKTPFIFIIIIILFFLFFFYFIFFILVLLLYYIDINGHAQIQTYTTRLNTMYTKC